MFLIELDDFEFWIDSNVVDDVYKFSPIFVFLVGWAHDEDFLEDSYLNSSHFEVNISKLKAGKIDFKTFVADTLKGKLEECMFKDSIKEFVSDYIELDGYSFDLSNFFKKALWDIPHSYENSKELFLCINQSRKNYEKHKLNNPELAIFEENYEL